jgi:hypothetical protein
LVYSNIFVLRKFVFLERRLVGSQVIRQEIQSKRGVEGHPPDHSFFHSFYLNKNDFILKFKNSERTNAQK